MKIVIFSIHLIISELFSVNKNIINEAYFTFFGLNNIMITF